MASGIRLVGVYESEGDARAAAAVARRVGAPEVSIRIERAVDRLASVQGEMREEMDHTVAGPGNVGPFTKEMGRGMVLGIVVGGVLGALVALPFAALEFGGFAWWARVLTVVVAGVLVGATAGWVIGGGFGARRPEEALAAERGVTLAVPALPGMEEALAGTEPIRLDVVQPDGRPVRTVTTEADRDPERVVDTIARHARDEPRQS